MAKYRLTYMKTWLSNEKISYKLSNFFWKALGISDAQATETLRLRYVQYTGNYVKDIFSHSPTPIPTSKLKIQILTYMYSSVHIHPIVQN